MASATIGAVIGGLAFKSGVTWFGTSLFASALTGAALGHSLFGPRASDALQDVGFDEAKFNTSAENLTIPIIYGRHKVTGNVIYRRVSSDNKRLLMAVALGEGEITGVTDIRADDELLGDLEGYIRHEIRHGTENQAPVSWLFKSDEQQERWKHTAYIALEFEASLDIWNIPAITAIVEGLKVQVRTGSTWTRQYSQNPIWCLYDLLTSTRYGVGVKPTDIDTASWQAAANYCNELVDGEPRFQLDINLDSQRPCLDIIDGILATCRGFLIYSDGKLRVQIEKDELPVQAFSPRNIIKDSFTFSQTSRSQIPNQISIDWLDPEIEFTQTSTIWNNEIDQEEGNRGVVPQAITLEGITRASQAGRMARFILDSLTQCQIVCSFQAGIDSIHCEVGDIIKVSHFVSGWEDKLFRIIELEEQENDEITIKAREHNPHIYHDLGVGRESRKVVAPPDPINPPGVPQNLRAYAAKIGAETVITASWAAVEHGFGVYYELQWRQESLASWQSATVHGLDYAITATSPTAKYLLRVRAISGIGQVGWFSDEISIDLTASPASLLPSDSLLPSNGVYPA